MNIFKLEEDLDFAIHFYERVTSDMLKKYAGTGLEETLWRIACDEEEQVQDGNELQEENVVVLIYYGFVQEDGKMPYKMKTVIRKIIEERRKEKVVVENSEMVDKVVVAKTHL